MANGALMQIGEVAERTSLSLRTIRYYEEVGLVVPSARSQGGFRLYTEGDVKRLWFIRRLKPLDLSLEQMRDLLGATDRLDSKADLTADEAVALRVKLVTYVSLARSRRDALRDQLVSVEEFSADLSARLAEIPAATDPLS